MRHNHHRWCSLTYGKVQYATNSLRNRTTFGIQGYPTPTLMIFAPTLSLAGFLLLVVLPLLSIPCSLLLAGYFLARRARVSHGAEVEPLSPNARGWWAALAVLCVMLDLWSGYVFYQSVRITQDVEARQRIKATRENFLLDRDFQYGELRLPRGSQIHRYDPFDDGTPDLPLALRGLRAARFPQPIEVARVWGQAMQVTGVVNRVELARDQVIGPRFAYNKQGVLAHDDRTDSVACKQGQIARFDVPSIEYDIVAEFGKPEPDGPSARFKPSQWQFLGCDDSGPITLPPLTGH